MANVAQVRILNYNNEDIGQGFNSDTGLAVGTCLDFTPPLLQVSQSTEGDVTIVTSHEELMTKMHMSAQLEGHYSVISAGGKVDYAKTTDYNSSSTFVLARSVIGNTITRGRDFKLKPGLEHLLDPDRVAEFNRAFGDSFVRAQITGGEFYALMCITSVDSKTESTLATSAQAAVTAGGAGGDFQGQLDKFNLDEKTKSTFSCLFYQTAGAGQKETGATLSVDDVKKRLQDFPDAVLKHPFPYFIEVATYDTVPLPIPSKEQQDDFLFVLADCDAKKLVYIQGRNDCDFAIKHLDFFFDPPTPVVLTATSEIYTQLLNAVILHAIDVSKGGPPILFDPGKLTPPLTEPTLILRKRDVGLEGSFVDFWVDRDHPATRKDDRDLAFDIGTLAAEQISDFSKIVDPGGNPEVTLHLQGEALARIVASFRDYNWDHAGQHDSNRGPLTSLRSLPLMLPRTIRSLSFESNQITDTRGLDQFNSLVGLGLAHNAIDSIAELGSLPLLRDLDLVDNGISDLTPLAKCVSLETLDISGNNISDLTPLGFCTRLKNLTLFGTELFIDGVPRPSGNPIVNVLALAKVPGTASPFTIGTTLSVRFGVLPDGPDAQFTGTATRVGNSHTFRVHLTRGAELLDDTWTLRAISALTPAFADEFKSFFPTLLAGDVPTAGASLNIVRGSVNSPFDFNFSFVDPANPKTCGIDLTAFPAFGTKIKFPTFDATVTS